MSPTDKASKRPEKSQAPESSRSHLSSHARARRGSAVDLDDEDSVQTRQPTRNSSSEYRDVPKPYRSTTRHGEASNVPRSHRPEKSKAPQSTTPEAPTPNIRIASTYPTIESLGRIRYYEPESEERSVRQDTAHKDGFHTVAESSRQPSQSSRYSQSSQNVESSKFSQSAPKSGMVGLTQYENNSMMQKTYPKTSNPTETTFRSRAPPSVKSVSNNPEDERMASRQSMYTSLRGRDLDEQKKWVSKTLAMNEVCPASYGWVRMDEGYKCKGGHHLITDELIAENKGGIYVTVVGERWGPYYASNENTKGLFWYAGPKPRPIAAGEWIGETDGDGRRWLKENWVEERRGMGIWHPSRFGGIRTGAEWASGGRPGIQGRSLSDILGGTSLGSGRIRSGYPNPIFGTGSMAGSRYNPVALGIGSRDPRLASIYDPSASRRPPTRPDQRSQRHDYFADDESDNLESILRRQNRR